MAPRRDMRGVGAALVALFVLTVAISAQVVPTPRVMAAPRDGVIRSGFRVLIPRDVGPETVKVFFAVAPSGVVPADPITTAPGVYDYTLPIAGASFLRLLIYAPGYQMVTAEFRDAQVNASSPYTLPLIKLPAVRLDGRLVDTAGRPVPNQTLDLSYDLWEAVPYFCGNCMLDGQIPTFQFGRTRTDDGGAFSFEVPNVRDDPFFQRYSSSSHEPFHLSARVPEGMTDDVLRPSWFSAPATEKKPFVVVHAERGVLSVRLGSEFLRQNGIGDLSAYRTGFGELGDSRLQIELLATSTDSGNGYNAILKADGTFERQLPPGSYDLTLSVFGPGGAVQRKISVEKVVLIREGQRQVVSRP